MERGGVEFLREIGVGRGCVVLDFGCGSGNYAIPVARVVGEEGRVYALDKNERSLDELMRRVESAGLRNIERMDSSGEPEIQLDDESVDVVLLYDIFWYFPLTDPNLTKLLNEVYRVSRPNALISVYPQHVDIDQLMDKIRSTGFRLEGKYSGMLVHYSRFERGQVFNFRKRQTEPAP